MRIEERKPPLIVTIDDEPTIRRSFRDYLEDADYEVDEAENGALGIELCAQKKPDLVLLDLSMPEMDGFEVLKHFTKSSPNTPIIVISGIGVVQDAVKALKLGAWDYLLKPIEDLTMLQHAVEKCLERATLIKENQLYQQNLEIEIKKRTRELDKTIKKLNTANVKLKNSENRFRTLANTSPMAIMMIQDQKPVYINPVGETITGYTFKELQKIKIEELFEDDVKEQLLKKIKTFEFEKPHYMRDEFKIITKDRSVKWVDVSGGYTELEDKLSGVISFADITKRKEYEETLKDINKELENRVSKRTSELEAANKKLQEAKPKADQATEAKSSFLANMSHEIRTPMNGVIAAVELALQEKASPEIQRFLNIIQSSGYSLLGVINDILDFSKIEAGMLELEMTNFNLDELIQDTTNPFISSAYEKNIDLLIDMDFFTPNRFVGDRLRIIQILSNLLSNAIKFTDELGTIIVGVKQDNGLLSDDQVELLFYVKDTGIGMSHEQQQKIFQPFTQADISTTRKFGGTGLGLSISKKLSTLMNGNIWVESNKDIGTTFYFSAIMKRQKAVVPKQNVLKAKEFKNLEILIVDDNPESANILTKILKSFGCNVHSAPTDENAVKIFRKQNASGKPFDLFIIDDYLPDTGSVENYRLISEIRQSPTPVILMNGLGKHSQLKHDVKQIFSCNLYKPFNARSVFDSLAFALGHSDSPYPKESKKISIPAFNYHESLQGLNILIAEDNPTNQDIASAILEKAGIHAEIAENGKDAIEAIKVREFDAVLMDVQMPIMDGFSATKTIRHELGKTTLPIIAMTAHAMKGDEEKCLMSGMNDYIAKPLNQNLLFKTIAKHTDRQSEPTGLASSVSNGSNQLQPDLPQSLPGLNIHLAMQTLGVNSNTYLKFVKRFNEFHKPLLQILKSNFESKNWDELKKMIHSIQGSASNIGGYQTREYALLLDSALNFKFNPEKDSAEIQPLFDQLYKEFDLLITSLEGLIETHFSAQHSKQIKSKTKQHSTEILKSALSDAVKKMNPKLIEAALLNMKQTSNQTVIAKIERKIFNYDYDEALELIKDL